MFAARDTGPATVTEVARDIMDSIDNVMNIYTTSELREIKEQVRTLWRL